MVYISNGFESQSLFVGLLMDDVSSLWFLWTELPVAGLHCLGYGLGMCMGEQFSLSLCALNVIDGVPRKQGVANSG